MFLLAFPFFLPLIIIIAVLYIIGIIFYLVVGTFTWFIFKLIFNKFFIICFLIFALFFFIHL